ncbi:hypothetical protein BDV09DRAFT_159592 [Aspergillus tetrazonus]
MNSGNDNWHPGGPSHPGMDQMNQPPRPLGTFSQNPTPQQGPSSQPSGPVLPPPAAPYHSAGQAGGHSLPGLAELSQTHGNPHPPPSYGQHAPAPSHGGGHSLPGIGQAMQHPSPQSMNQDRERDSRDREIIERQRQEEMVHRERERERERDIERQQLERQRDQQHHPVQSHTGSIPLHQPVASKVPNTIHGPGGLLSNLGPNPPNGPQNAMQASGGPGGMYGSQIPHGEGTPRSYMQHAAGPPGQPLMAFNGGGPSIPGNVAALAQGQQPILNDALSYLDQVKVRFVDQPDVYNRFLDIMKDFKSQAIDTPGVIQRVSNLFNGHPALIQGFNTFLPPGYRIECGTEDNPDAIRVTTPSGTNTLSMPRARHTLDGPSDLAPPAGLGPHGRPDYYEHSRPGWQQQQPQSQQPQGGFSDSPGARMMGGLFPQQAGQGQPQDHHYEYTGQQEQPAPAGAAVATHGQDQRGVSQLQGAASAASAGLGRASLLGAGPSSQGPSMTQPMNNLAGVGSGVLQGSQADLKRGPVEFNHAISYVNKIKNRFSSRPEIYKQFLEILQTYQRESKPIGDVYTQVTQLFNSAPDLLEDFKQFLPESAAHAKQQAALRQQAEENAPMSNLRGDPNYAPGSLTSQTPNRDVKMPPLGNFNVKDSAKDGKKRRTGPGAPTLGGSSVGPAGGVDAARMVDSQAGRGQVLPAGNANKRAKVHHTKPSQAEAPVVSPTLVPALPEPVQPTFSLTPTQEEFAFFDRVKKYIGNKQTFSEFLKLCNLYSTDLIDRHVLVKRAAGYIGSNPELMAWFKRFMHVEEPEDKIVEVKPKQEPGIVNLSHCRSLGPSYRLLPKRERQKPCSGRDELCRSVLNDEWASHPTWASEDSGFVAHRKNQYEDALHRIEEDRHDYDHHIEACNRTIQLIEPIVQQFLVMTEAERAAFQLPRGLGGQSEAIYQRVIKKIYDRQRGERIIKEMFERPCHVLPIVLFRLKQKCEEWKASQREWDKIWREQMQKAYWRSLDHQAIASKGVDKKLFVAKHIQTEIQAKHEESKNLRKSGFQVPKHQFEFSFTDPAVLIDATHLLLTFIDRNSAGFGADPQKVMMFIKDFIPVFFGMDRDTFHVYMNELSNGTSPIDEGDDESSAADDAATSRSSRKGVTNKKIDLLRDVLERRSEKASRNDKEGSAPASRDGTPDAVLVSTTPIPDPTETFDVAELKWMEHPGQGNFNQHREYNLNETYEKKAHHLYANLNIYCFFRTFEILYSRLLRIKLHEKEAHEVVRRALVMKPARELNLIDKVPTDFFYDTDPKANLYQQIVRMCEEVIKGDLESSHLEETLRRYYLRSGYQLYNLEKMFTGIAKFAGAIFNGDSKDRSSDIINLFFKERDKDETTHNQEIQYRKQVERLVKDSEIFRITYYPDNQKTTVQLLTPEDATLENEELSQEARWSYYVSAYTMRDPTEGVPFSQMRMPFLKRNLPGKLEQEEEYNRFYRPLVHQDGLIIRICANSYHILYEPGSYDWWYRPALLPDETSEDTAKEEAAVKERRRDRFTEKFVNNPSWAHGLSKDQVDESNQRFRSWIKGSEAENAETSAPAGSATDKPENKDDVEMPDAEKTSEAES